MTTETKNTPTNAKPNALATESSTSETKGEATAVASMHRREKKKAISSCRMVPGMMSTQKPTRKSFFHASKSSHAKKCFSKSSVRKPRALLSAVGFSSRIALCARQKSPM